MYILYMCFDASVAYLRVSKLNTAFQLLHFILFLYHSFSLFYFVLCIARFHFIFLSVIFPVLFCSLYWLSVCPLSYHQWMYRTQNSNLDRKWGRDGNLRGSDKSNARTVSPEPSFTAPWSMGDAMVGRGNSGWTKTKGGHLCPCQNCWQRASCRQGWERISAESSLMSPRRLHRLST